MPSYSVSFPDIEVNSINGHQAILDAIEQLKTPQKDWPLLFANEISWSETHDDSCDCNACEESK